jgi:hypothetical protein
MENRLTLNIQILPKFIVLQSGSVPELDMHESKHFLPGQFVHSDLNNDQNLETKILCYMENRLTLNIQILPKFIVEAGGSDYSIFAFFRTRYVYCKIWKHIFFKQKTYHPPL